MTEPTTTIILPTYNEAENIEKTIEEIAKNLHDHTYEIIVVDDDSPDRTWEIAAKTAEKGHPVKVILRTNEKHPQAENIQTVPLKKRGLSAAVIEGFKHAKGKIVVVMDADGQHPPEKLPQLIEKTLHECDLTIGSRYVKGAKIEKWSPYRLIVSKAFTILAKTILPQLRKISDVNAGYFAVRKEIIKKSVHTYDGYGFKILWEIIVKGKPQKICEIPITFRNRRAGKSKAGIKVAIEGFKSLIKLRTHRE